MAAAAPAAAAPAAASAAPAIIGAVGSVLGGLMGGKGSGGSNIDYAQSPEQRAVFQAAMPNLQRLFQGGNIYDIPGIEGITPGANWYQDLSPEIKSGIQSPYIDASRQLTESLGGSAGSARAGSTGALIGRQSDFWADAGTQMGTQAWNMVAPAQNAMWQAQLQQNMMPFTGALGAIQSTYGQPVVSPDTGFNWPAALGGGLTGGYGGYQLGQQWPQNTTPWQTGWSGQGSNTGNFQQVIQQPRGWT